MLFANNYKWGSELYTTRIEIKRQIKMEFQAVEGRAQDTLVPYQFTWHFQNAAFTQKLDKWIKTWSLFICRHCFQKTPKMTSNKRYPLRLYSEKLLLEYTQDTNYRATLIFVHHDSRTSGMSGYSACFTVCHVYLIYGSILSYLFTSKKKKHSARHQILSNQLWHVKWWNSQHSTILAFDSFENTLFTQFV